MKKFLQFALFTLLVAACSKEAGAPAPEPKDVSLEPSVAVSHSKMVLGRKLDNPYTVRNVRKAMASVYPTRSASSVQATDLYVRFLPDSPKELQTLEELGLELFDYPLDYEIQTEGDWYHDPSVPQESITWQYTLVPPGFDFPKGIDYEVLDECCLPERAVKTRGLEDLDWASIERQAYEVSGNAELLEPATRGRHRPSGRITIVDNSYGSSRTSGVAGVRVRVHTFVRYDTDYTDSQGYYNIGKSYSAKPRYAIVYKNERGFSIGFNLIIVPASTSTFGKGSPSGMDIRVDKSSDQTLYRRCAVNNSAYDYYTFCQKNRISTPPSDLRIWILNTLRPSSAIMLHHGAFLDSNLSSKFFNVAKWIIRFFSPDVTIGTSGKNLDYQAIFAATVHELAHTSHFRNVGTSYWNMYGHHVVSSYVMTGDCYGSGSELAAGYCGVGEMWAYHIENELCKDRYKRDFDFGSSYWFHPGIFKELEKLGFSKAVLFSALRSDVTSIDALKEKLCAIKPHKAAQVRALFEAA